MLDVVSGDIVLLNTGEEVQATDVADAPETLFVYDSLRVTDRAFVVRNYSAEKREESTAA